MAAETLARLGLVERRVRPRGLEARSCYGRGMRVADALWAAVLLAGCGERSASPDAHFADAGGSDAGVADAAAFDGSIADPLRAALGRIAAASARARDAVCDCHPGEVASTPEDCRTTLTFTPEEIDCFVTAAALARESTTERWECTAAITEVFASCLEDVACASREAVAQCVTDRAVASEDCPPLAPDVAEALAEADCLAVPEPPPDAGPSCRVQGELCMSVAECCAGLGCIDDGMALTCQPTG